MPRKKKFKYRPPKIGEKKKQEDAIYQFILDHATPVPKGFHIQFYIRNRKDFFTRVQARRYGFERMDAINEEWEEVHELDKELESLREARKVWWKKFLLNKMGL